MGALSLDPLGLFDSKKIYRAFAGSSTLFEERPNTLKSTILQTAIGNEGTMGQAVRWTIGTDVFARAKAMYRYAAKFDDPTREGGYIRGLPTSNMTLVTVDPGVIEAALSRAVGAWDNIKYTLKGVPNEEFFLSQKIQELYTDTLYFPWPDGLPTETHWDEYREDVPIPVVNPDTGIYYTSSNAFTFLRYTLGVPSGDFRDILGDDEFVRSEFVDSRFTVSFPYIDKDGVDQEYELPRLIDIGEQTGSWIMVAYDLAGKTYYWAYNLDSGVDPIFEAAVDLSTKEAQFLPVAVLMQDEVWFNEDPDSDLAITTNKLLKRMGTSGDDIREEYEQAVEEADEEQTGRVWDFFVHFAVPIDTQVRGSLEYLWFFFKEMSAWSTYDYRHYYDYLNNLSTAQPINELIIKEAGVNGYNVAYRWSYIYEKEFSGEYTYEKKIWDRLPDAEDENDVGEWHFETTTLKGKEVAGELFQREEVLSTEYQETVDNMFGPATPVGPWNDPDKEKDDDKGFHDFYIITRQNPEDPDNPGVPQGYVRILVMALSMQYKINTKDEDKGKNGYRFRYATPMLFGEEEETKEFKIPLLYSALKEVPTLHREEAVTDGFTATVFLVHREKVRWYQRTFFKWLFVVIAVVLILLALFYPPFWLVVKAYAGAIAGILGGAAIATAVVMALMVFAMGFIISMAGSVITEEFGATAGFIFQLIAAIAFFQASGGFDALSQSWSSVIQSPGWGTAVNFINAVTPVYNMGFSVYQNRVMAGIEDDMKDFLVSAKEKNEMLKEAWAGIGDTQDWIDPLDLVNMFRRIGQSESASGYLTRTLNPNPGLLGIEAVTQFPQIALSLPQNLGEATVVDSMMQEFATQRGAV